MFWICADFQTRKEAFNYFFDHPKCGNSDHETGIKFGICTSDLFKITSRICTSEMETFGTNDCWLSRVRNIQLILNIPVCPTYLSEKTVSKIITDKIKSKLDRFYLDEICIKT